MKTNIRILRGHQIGGCITVIATETTKIVIDFGESLPGAEVEEDIEFDWKSENVDAVFFTHYHGDHIGRFMEVPETVPLYMGEVTYKVMLNIREALSGFDPKMKKEAETLRNRKNIQFLVPNQPKQVGNITVTPYAVDHSAFDAYMFLVFADGENILHTGDYRDHGHRGHKKETNGEDRNILLEVIEKYVLDQHNRRIDALITEGTMMTRLSEERYSEKQMMRDAAAYFKENRYIFLKISSTNVDSLASFAKAAKENGIKMYVNRYLMNQIRVYREAGEKNHTNMYAFENVLPLMSAPEDCVTEVQRESALKQRRYMRKDGFVIIASERDYFEKTITEFSDIPVKTIYSMWAGYIDPQNKAFDEKIYRFCKRTDAKVMHTSGHAYPELIAKVIELIDPEEEIIPIHTEAVDEFYNLDIRQELKNKIRRDLCDE